MTKTVQIFENGVLVREEQWEVPAPTIEEVNEEAIRTNLVNYTTSLRGYLNLASPTAAQNTSAIRLTVRVVISLIRLALRQLDATD